MRAVDNGPSGVLRRRTTPNAQGECGVVGGGGSLVVASTVDLCHQSRMVERPERCAPSAPERRCRGHRRLCTPDAARATHHGARQGEARCPCAPSERDDVQGDGMDGAAGSSVGGASYRWSPNSGLGFGVGSCGCGQFDVAGVVERSTSFYGVGMDAWILDESPGRYRRGTIDDPVPGPDEVRIRVVASALNHMDLWVTKGLPRPPLPHIPGCDAAGVVDAVGANVTSVRIGDEVVVNPGVSPVEDIVRLGNDSPVGPGFMIWGEHCRGGHASFAIAPDRNVRPRPPGRTWHECAAFPLAYLTAYRMLRRARVSAGETVLVVGIGSGVSVAALSLARWMGATVVATSRDPRKREEALRMGAVQAVDSEDDRWGVEAHVVVESVGPATWDKSVRSLRPGGRLVVCGGTSGSEVGVQLPRLFFKQHEIIGSSMGSYQEFDELLELVGQGLPIAVDGVFGFEEYPDALLRLERGEQLGKIVIDHRSAS